MVVLAGPGFFSSQEMVEYTPRATAFDHKSSERLQPSRISARNGHYLDASYDHFGRMSKALSKNGNEWVFIYDNLSSKVASKVLLNGTEKQLPLKRGGERLKYITAEDEDFEAYLEQLTGYIGGYGGCIGCVGLTDNISDLVDYVSDAGTIGALMGLAVSLFTEAEAAAMFYAMGFGWLLGVGLATSVAAGWYIGSWIYDTTTGWIYRPGAP